MGMKKILIASLMALSFNVAAEQDCTADAEMAYSIMTARQNEVDRSMVMLMVYSDPVYSLMVIRAYDTPVMDSDATKNSVKAEFKQWALTACNTYNHMETK